MKNILQIILIVLLAMSSVFIYAKDGGGMHGKGKGFLGGKGGWLNEKVLKDIGVSDTVKKQIREIAQNARKDMMETHKQLQEKMIALHKEYFKATLDEAKIETLTQEIWDLFKTKHEKMAKAKLQVIKLLTGEQREKLGTYIEKHKKEHMGEMMHQED